MGNGQDQFEYDVALSFAGEDRAIVEEFANLLVAKNIKVFYDNMEISTLWGKNLVDHLADIYSKKARYCVMFISHYYPLKKWTKLERTHAQARAFRDANEYILPIRLDDTEVPGIAETIGYIDLRQQNIEIVANEFEKKLTLSKRQTNSISTSQLGHAENAQAISSPFGTIPLPKIKKTFTQLEKDRFAKEAFEYVKKYFQHALHELKTSLPETETDFTETNNIEFTCKIYVQGNVKSHCNIWLGDSILPNTIYYSEATNSLGGGKSINDYLPVIDNEEKLFLQIGNFGMGSFSEKEKTATQQQAAEYLWKRFISRLEYR